LRELSALADTDAGRSGPRITRRSLLGGAAVGAGTAGAGFLGGHAYADQDPAAGAGTEPGRRYVPFAGPHQTGITTHPVPALGLMAAFTCVAGDRDDLRTCLAELTDEIRRLMAGEPIEQRPPAYPPVDSGILGAQPPADNLSVVVSVGASLFVDRYGLAGRRPRELVQMPFLANDRLDPDRSHGDLLLTVEAEHADTLQFALRQLMRRTREWLVLKWMVDGYTRGTTPTSAPGDDTAGAPRNLMGFKDGTANLDSTDAGVMDRYMWTTGAAGGEPAWAAGGSYHVVRVIRMFVEFWDRTQLGEQEAIIGRHKLSGAPLGRSDEHDEPAFDTDPDGETTPLDAHIRLANPRTAASDAAQIFRRGFSYSRGFDGAGQLDQGLAFVCYQRSLDAGFLAVQRRLAGEPLEEYILPEGGGFFFALPGVPGAGGFLGDGLVPG